MNQSAGKPGGRPPWPQIHQARANHPPEQTRLLDVVIISTSDQCGQAEEQVRALSTGLRDLGHSVRVVAHADSPLAAWFNAHGFEVEAIQGWDRGPAALWRMRRYLKQTSPEVVHFTDSRALRSGGMAVFGLGVPVRIYSYRTGSTACSPVSARMFSDVIVCDSQLGVDTLVQQGVPWPNVHLIRDALELSRTVLIRWSSPRPVRSFGPAPRLLTVTPMSDASGWQRTLDSLSVVRRRYAEAGIRVLAGNMDIRGLQKAAADQGHAGRIEMHRGMHGLTDLLPESDVFVIPSRIVGDWNVLAEVMLSGTPIVTIPNDLTGEWLGPRAAGMPVAWFSETTAAESLGRAMLQALSDADESRARAANGCRRVSNDFTGGRFVAEVLQLYLDQLSKPRQVARAA